MPIAAPPGAIIASKGEDADAARLRRALRQVPPPPTYPRPLRLTPVLVSPIPPRQAQSILSALATTLPLPGNLSHLKRVRRSGAGASLSILLCASDAWDALPPAARATISPFALAPVPHDVPASAPECASETSAWNAHWPCILRARRPPPPTLTASELVSAARHLRSALSLADAAPPAGAQAAAILVDPATGEVVASATDRSGRPGAKAGGGLIEHAAMRVVSAAATPHVAGPRSNDARYLATGLDCYLAREPCAMCAMALVHARVGRVFFARAPPGIGGLSDGRVHCEPRMNHRYLAFCLPEEALLPVGEDDAPSAANSFCKQL